MMAAGEEVVSGGGETDRVLRRADPLIVGRLYRLLTIFMAVAERCRIPFWLCEGSFLGAVRHGGIIPWDDDVDLQFLEEHEKTLWEARPEFRRHGCELTKWWGGYKIFFPDGQPVRRHSHRYPFLDLFPSRRTRRGRIVYARLLARWGWRHIYFREEELFPLVPRPFGPLEVPCPQDHGGYFLRNYGPDWNTVACVTYDHEHEKEVPPRKVRLTDRAPARYILP
jgi:lipopolysaccharide cholinephosphotransferase